MRLFAGLSRPDYSQLPTRELPLGLKLSFPMPSVPVKRLGIILISNLIIMQHIRPNGRITYIYALLVYKYAYGAIFPATV